MKINIRCKRLAAGLTVFAGLALAAGPAMGQVTNLSTDVAQAIDDGLAQLDAWGAYSYPGCSAGDATGLTLLALLEKRLSADPSDPAQGYASASLADQARMENAAHCILNHYLAFPYSYRDGQDLMALSLYLRTGGPDIGGAPISVIGFINWAFDRALTTQNALGYWCYNFAGCNDASTTQFMVNGMAAVRAVYSQAPWTDAVRLAQADAALALTRSAYESADQTGGPGGVCDAFERGHGYNRVFSPNTLHQTSAGIFAMLNGGAGLNDEPVQQYLTWIYNRYRYTSIAGHDWSFNSFFYYLWASTKAFEFIEASGATPDAGNLGVEDIGTATAGFCGGTEENRDPLADSQVPRFGAGGAGYYGDHPAGFYYNYAYRLLSIQTGAVGSPGEFTTGPDGSWDGGGGWNDFSRQSYAILVLLRSVGGAPPVGEFTKELTSGPDYDGDGEIDLVVEVNTLTPETYDFTITYTLPGDTPVLIEDTVPAEWNVTLADDTLSCTAAQANKGGKADKSATKISCEEPNDGSVVVYAETRCHDNRNNQFCRPTSCGALWLNDGALAYEVDEFGEPLVDEFGERLPPIGTTEGICLAAVYDVGGDGIDWTGTGDEDGDSLSDYDEACSIGTDPCLADSDGDGVFDNLDECPLEGDEGYGVDAVGCPNVCPCFTSEDIAANGTILECGSNFPGFPDLTGVIWDDSRRACSGTNCAVVGPPTCAIQLLAGGFISSSVDAAQDATCRAMILDNCASPNLTLTLTDAPASTTPFTD